MVFLIFLVVFLANTGHSSAAYCLCKDGVNEQTLQKTLDYACGAGADCSAISQNGACYNPNTVKDHCNYAVNSYFQKKGQAQGSCDFSGAATVSSNPPANVPSTCSYSSSSTSTTPTTSPTTGTPTPPTTGTPSTTPTTGTPSTTPTTPTTGTPTTPTTGTPSTTPTTGTNTGTTSGIPSTTPNTGTNTGTTTGTPTVFGGGTNTLGPTGTSTSISDPSHAASLFTSTTTNILFTFAITLWILG